MFIYGICIGFILYVLWIMRDAYFRVEEGQVAIVKAFGGARYENGKLKTYGPGLHSKLFWEEAEIVSLREQAIELSGERGGQTVLADDGTALRLDSTLRFEPIASSLASFLFSTRAPVEHVTGLLTCVLRNEVANLGASGGSGAPDELGAYALIRRGRRMLNERINEFGREILQSRYGIRFVSFDLVDIHPPDELADALNAVIHAKINAEAEFHRAQSESQKQLLAAQEGVSIARTKAQAVATEIVELGRHLEKLADDKVLSEYVARRSDEVLSDAKTVYFKEVEGT